MNNKKIKAGIFLLIAVVFVALIGGFFLNNHLGKKQVENFIRLYINSIIADSDYYRQHTTDRVIKDVHIFGQNLSKDFSFGMADYSWGVYEYLLVFQDGDKIYMDIDKENNRFIVTYFVRRKY